MASDIRRQADDLVRFFSELVRRLPQHGIQDVADLLAQYERVRGAVGAISRQEIIWAADQAQGLMDELVRLEQSLETVRRLKATIERPSGGRLEDGVRGGSSR